MSTQPLLPPQIFTPALPTREEELFRVQYADWVLSITTSPVSRFGEAWVYTLGADDWTRVALH